MFIHSVELISYTLIQSICCYHASCNNQSETSITEAWHMEIPSSATFSGTDISRDHSFPQHTEFWAELRNLPLAVEFLCFRWILRNSVLAVIKGTNAAQFGRFQVAILYVYMISPWNTWLPIGP